MLLLMLAAVSALPAQVIEVKSVWELAPLAGTWRSIEGDDPRFAEPAFDDSSWTPTSLPAGRELVPRRVMWLRVRVRLPDEALPVPLAVLIPPIAGRYDLFINGRMAGSFGRGGLGKVPACATYPLPAGRDLSIAIRVVAGLGPFLWYYYGFQQPVLIGPAATIEGRGRELELATRWRAVPGLLMMAATVVAGLFFVVIPLWRSDAMEYFWCGSVLILGIGLRLVQVCPWLWDEQQPGLAFTYVIAVPYVIAWERLFRSLFQTRLSRPARWLTPILVVPTLLVLLTVLFDQPAYRFLWSVYPVLFVGVLALLYLDLARRGVRSEDSNWLHGAVGLYLGSNFIFFGLAMAGWLVGRLLGQGYDIQVLTMDLRAVSMLLFAGIMAGLLHRRSARMQVDQQRLKQELEAGAEMQALLLHSEVASVPGFAIDKVYLPASEVGGDFHYTLVDGDAVVVLVGDVSGKGLRAAMLVTMVTGILRETQERMPAKLLGALNRSLAGQTRGGFVTCCAARFTPDGRVAVANAGHLAPYVDGREADVEAGLPLGLAPDLVCPETRLQGTTFTFVSDGVVEAENVRRELFGFDRTRDISTQPAPAIAHAAQAWGQTDDITVVTVRKTGK